MLSDGVGAILALSQVLILKDLVKKRAGLAIKKSPARQDAAQIYLDTTVPER